MYKFGIENFKSFARLNTIRLAPITLIYGQNSAGKSSITQALRLLLQSFKNAEPGFKLLLNGESIELGLPETFFHKARVSRPITYYFEGPLVKNSSDEELGPLGIEFRAKYPRIGVYLHYVYVRHSELSYAVQLDRIEYVFIGESGHVTSKFSLKRFTGKNDFFKFADASSVTSAARYLWLRNRALEERKSAGKGPTGDGSISPDALTKENLAERLSNAKFGETEKVRSPLRFPMPLPELDWYGSINRDADWFIYSSLSRLNQPVHQILMNFLHIAGLRNSPQRHYGFGVGSEFVGKYGEHTATVLYRKTGSMLKMNGWFKLLELPYRISVEPIKHPLAGEMLIIKLKDIRNGAVVTPSDVGVGISQVLPLLTQGMADQEPKPKRRSELSLSIRCVEQPELHLHPKLQANLADFFIESTKVSSNLRWVLETHSESLMLRLQRRVRETKLSPSQVSVNYVNSSRGGGSKITELRLDSSGQFMDEWPEGFFEEGFNERFGG